METTSSVRPQVGRLLYPLKEAGAMPPTQLPALSDTTIAAELRLYEATQPVLEAWQDVRDNLCEELERRDGMTMFPPGGRERALRSLERLSSLQHEAAAEIGDLLAFLSQSNGPGAT
jgi:hypothetical protein